MCAGEQGTHKHTPPPYAFIRKMKYECENYNSTKPSTQTGDNAPRLHSTAARPASPHADSCWVCATDRSVTHGDIKGMRCEESCLINQRLRWARSTQPVCSLMWFQSTVASLLSVLGACAHTGLFPPVFRTICIST